MKTKWLLLGGGAFALWYFFRGRLSRASAVPEGTIRAGALTGTDISFVAPNIRTLSNAPAAVAPASTPQAKKEAAQPLRKLVASVSPAVKFNNANPASVLAWAKAHNKNMQGAR